MQQRSSYRVVNSDRMLWAPPITIRVTGPLPVKCILPVGPWDVWKHLPCPMQRKKWDYRSVVEDWQTSMHWCRSSAFGVRWCGGAKGPMRTHFPPETESTIRFFHWENGTVPESASLAAYLAVSSSSPDHLHPLVFSESQVHRSRMRSELKYLSRPHRASRARGTLKTLLTKGGI